MIANKTDIIFHSKIKVFVDRLAQRGSKYKNNILCRLTDSNWEPSFQATNRITIT